MNWVIGKKQKRRNRIKAQFGKNPMELEAWESLEKRMREIRMYEELVVQDVKKEEWQSAGSVDTVTWNDLEMDRVFARINHTRTYMGEQILYHRLHNMQTRQSCEDMEKRISFFSCRESIRTEIEEKLMRIGKQKESCYLPFFLTEEINPLVIPGAILYFLQGLLAFCLIGAILLRTNLWATGFLVVAVVNLLIYLHTKCKYEGNLFMVSSLKELFDFCNWIVKKLEPDRPEILHALEKTQKLSHRMLRWQTRKYQSMSGDVTGILWDYIAGITLHDVVAFYRIQKTLRACKKETMQLYTFAGEIDMEIAIASFRKSLPQWCCPSLQSDGAISVEEIRHPLMADAIPNDFVLKKGVVLTGANASGKSTFMKAVAINVILAQTINTCVAKNMKMPAIQVMTSMALRDDVLQGESYYMREIKYLKRMLDELKTGESMLFVIDEILKGTNTRERLAASNAILSYMVQKQGFLLIATHDLELVYALKNRYDTYYFDSQVHEKDIVFPYKIRRGIVGKTNAIDLMELLDFPEEITDQARREVGKR